MTTGDSTLPETMQEARKQCQRLRVRHLLRQKLLHLRRNVLLYHRAKQQLRNLADLTVTVGVTRPWSYVRATQT
jgi:hypothetical protein